MGVFRIIATGWWGLFRTLWMLFEPCQADVLGEEEEEEEDATNLGKGKVQNTCQSWAGKATANPLL